ncbi:MAG: hypothetical protein HDR35_02120 [Treponema sp.]|nr:hypothetical protein [Treponema sp.]
MTSIVPKSSVPFFCVSLMACLSVFALGFVPPSPLLSLPPPFPSLAFEQPNVIRLNERNNVNTPPHTTGE